MVSNFAAAPGDRVAARRHAGAVRNGDVGPEAPIERGVTACEHPNHLATSRSASARARPATLREKGRGAEFKPDRPLVSGGADAGTFRTTLRRTNARWKRSTDFREMTEAIGKLEADGAAHHAGRVPIPHPTRVRGCRTFVLDRETRQPWLGRLDPDTTARPEIAGSTYRRQAAAATDAIICEIDRHWVPNP